MTDTLYVTALYNFGRKSIEGFIADFTPFLKSSLHIYVFTDQESLTLSATNVTVHYLPAHTSGIAAFQQTAPILPEHRNPTKDTLEFLQLMNAKPEFLKRAAELVSVKAKQYVWFDFGILKISKSPDTFIQRLGRAAEAVEYTPGKVIIPGCISRERMNVPQLFSSPIWRFCGGIVIVPAALVETFHTYQLEQLKKCVERNVLTWEVNLWATIEQAHPELFHWYSADHNDTIVEFPLPPLPGIQKRIIFLSMIKNESKIIKRCIESAVGVADAVCICDTGSTDTTVEVLKEYFKDFSIPAKVVEGPQHAWRNFGYNRSQSFLAVVEYCKELGWDPEHTYALALDADMELKPQSLFTKEELTANGYKLIQKNPSLEYYNTRLMKIAHPWKCTGVTHEYWDGGHTETMTPDKLYISDIGDGGCKADKFERDVRLLSEGLEAEPNNPRYIFYLAQSYKDNKQLDKSIEFYKRRIDAGGWYEEVWYSMYMLMKLYAEKGQFAEMEMWGQKAFEQRPQRSENLLYLCRHFRDRRQYWKAWHYYSLGADIKKPGDLLFIESDVYTKGFDYERSIIHDYVFPHKKRESLTISLNHYNKWHENFAYTNIQWFVTAVPCKVREFHFQNIGDFVPTSTCILALPDGRWRLNVRYVNYRIQPNGGYMMSKDGVLSGNNAVRTENYTCLMDSAMNIISPLLRMDVRMPPLHDKHIKGLEDLRIFYDAAGQMRFFGTSMEYSYNGKIRQIAGRYNVDTACLEDLKSLKPASETDCEKNWIPYKGDKVIYAWHPFQIGIPDADGKLDILVRQETPKFLQHMRGSSTLWEDGDYFWGITHCVMYLTPRKYYHMVVKIDKRTDRLVGYTLPFFFQKNSIEYCLGYVKKDDTHICIVSQWDADPVMIEMKDSDVTWVSL
jgi:glycosyltransferase involved in cell wall biosynthesis